MPNDFALNRRNTGVWRTVFVHACFEVSAAAIVGETFIDVGTRNAIALVIRIAVTEHSDPNLVGALSVPITAAVVCLAFIDIGACDAVAHGKSIACA